MKSVKVGIAYKKPYKDGEYLKVILNDDTTFALFPNDRKTKDTHPDYRVIMEQEEAQKRNLADDYDRARIADEAKAAVQQVLGTKEKTKKEDKPDGDEPF